VAKYKKKRVRELRHDRFRDTTMTLLERVGNLFEGRGSSILYALGGLLVAALIVVVFIKWNGRKNDEARQALGRAINISSGSIAGATTPGSSTGPTFSSEQERAQKAIEEFEKVAAKYGDPYKTEARYFIATNRLSLDRPKAISELSELANSKITEVAVLSKFALAQAKEADGKLDEASQIYAELARLNNEIVTAETANLRLAKVYEKQGKKKEAADLLFAVVDASRKQKSKDGLPLPPSAAARDAADELQKLDPNRYAQLPPEAPPLG
jgi:tetratricopeptide (TPR) repeat protein